MKENNRMGKTRDLRKIRDTNQGNISPKDGHNKGEKWCGSNRVAEDIKKRWQEYTKELHKKDFHNSDNYSPRARHPEK